jgi:hypothetical protein
MNKQSFGLFRRIGSIRIGDFNCESHLGRRVDSHDAGSVHRCVVVQPISQRGIIGYVAKRCFRALGIGIQVSSENVERSVHAGFRGVIGL